MKKLSRIIGAVVATCSLHVLSANAEVPALDREEQILTQLMQRIQPTFACENRDLADQQFSG